MTAHERDLLNDLLTTAPDNVERVLDQAYQEHVAAAPLTPSSERALLRAAEAAGPVTLTASSTETQVAHSPIETMSDFVRRYPLVAVGAVAGAAYLLARRRK